MQNTEYTEYIRPNFSLANSFESLLKASDSSTRFYRDLDDEQWVDLEQIIEYGHLFIVAEPGQGKSRLLKELCDIAKSRDEDSLMLELKNKHSNESVEAFIQRSNPYFGKNKKNGLLLLDGLDEITNNSLISTIEYIKEYIIRNPKIKVHISSRIHFFSKYQHFLSGIENPTFLEIEHLTKSQSRQFLTNLDIPNETIERLFVSLNFSYDRVSVLQSPRYLEMLAKQVTKYPEIANNLNRAALFESFVKEALNIEDGKQAKQLGVYKKRFLERLALSMEIAQKNVITEDDLTTFIDEVESNANNTLLNQIGDIENLYEHSLLKKTGEEISFTNLELQEYLASKSILRLPNPVRVVYELAVEPNMREPIPSWFNALSFLIDELPILAINIMNLHKESGRSQDEKLHQIVTSSTSQKMKQSDKDIIFRKIYSYYFDLKQIIDSDVCFNLANYSSESTVSDFVKELKKLKNTPISREDAVNIIRLIGDMAKLNKINGQTKELARTKLLNLSLNSDDAIIQHNSINALEGFGDESVIEKLYVLKDHEDDIVSGSLIGLAYSLNKNNKKSIELFIDNMRKGHSTYSSIGLESIDDQLAMDIFISRLSTDIELIHHMVESIGDNLFENKKFITSLRKLWKDEWLIGLKMFVIKAHSIDAGYYAERSVFHAEIINLISEKDPKYFSELIHLGLKDLHFMYSITNSLARMMKIEHLSIFDELMPQDTELQSRLFDILIHLSYSDNPDAVEIEDEARKLFPDLYKEHDKRTEYWKKRSAIDRATIELNERIKNLDSDDANFVYTNFVRALEQVVTYLANTSQNKTPLNFTDEHIVKLWDKAKVLCLDKFDPKDTKLTINDRSTGHAKEVTITTNTRLFEYIVRFSDLTKRSDVGKYRLKMISAIPYAFPDQFESILNLLGDLSESEKEIAIQAYSDINKDEAFYMPENLINIAQQHQIFQSVPILDAFVEYDDLSEYVRIDALKTSENLKPNIKRLKKIFSKYKNGNEIEVKIAHTAVGLLASNHKDNSSVLWILRAAKANAFENVDTLSSKYRPVGVFDRDIREGDLIQPLKNVDDPIYVEEYLKLLDFSFELIGRGITWHNYAAYLWSAIDQYFNNLVVKGDYSYFDALEKRVQDFNNVVSTAPYIRHLNFIKGNYLQSLSKPKLFISSLQVLNKYKSETVDSIVSELDLHNKVIEVIEKDLIRWVDNEGRKILGYDEVSAQRSIAIIMENFFLKRGFKKEEVSRNNITFLREAQAVDDTRTDFLIYSGFIGPEVIELKRSSHNDLSGDIEKKKSFMSLEKYIKQFDAENAIFLVYETKNRSKAYWDRHLKKIDHIYSKIKGVKVIGMRNEYSLKKLYSKKKK